MRDSLRTITAIGIIAVAALGCRADTSGLAVVEVADAAAMAARGEIVFCDANNADTRGKLGTVPGAVLLSRYDTYDTASEIPTGAKLVFYCHSEMCGAAATAARRAIAAGHADVSVMVAGIKGWTRAGLPVDRPAEG